jgi:transcription termination factor Rho
MEEPNEQPALLGDETDSNKKPKRARSSAGSGVRRTAAARRSGGRRSSKGNHATASSSPSSEEALSENPVEKMPVNQKAGTQDESNRNHSGDQAGSDAKTQTEERSELGRPMEESRAMEDAQPVASGENGRQRTQNEVTIVEQPKPEPVYGEGLIEVSGKGFGFLRDPKRNYVQSPQDIFVTPEVVRKHALRDGLWVKGEIRRGSRGPQLFKLTEINGEDPERYRNLPVFEELTSINPVERIRLETVPDRYTTRVMDLMTPIGKGQRGLIVAPPRTGKTTLLQHIADAVVRNHPETSLIILLVDERPEEVTEIRRTVPKADIMASSNDSDIKSHTRIAQLAIERAKRLVEANRDVFVLMDSLTRVGRAFNNASAGSGRTMSGGMDSRAMEIPRKLFAAARNTEEAGSLTIMATALIETGSKMDELIFQEFKGTGNMEMVLDRQISDQRTYPSVDIFKSGTRREELLLPAKDLEKINTIRRGLAGHRPTEAIERLLSFLRKFPTNAQMLREIPG